MGFLGLFKPNIEKLIKNKDIHGLVKALGNKNEDTRLTAAKVLLEIGDRDTRVVDSLLRALNDKNPRIKTLAAAVLLKKKEWKSPE